MTGVTRGLLLLAACSLLGAWSVTADPPGAEGFGVYPFGLLAVALLQVHGRQLVVLSLVSWGTTAAVMWGTGQSAVEAVAYAAGGVVAALVALRLLQAHSGRFRLHSESDLLRFLLASVAGSVLAGGFAVVGAALARVDDLGSLALASVLSAAGSLLVWLPLALPRRRSPGLAGWRERIAQWTVLLVATLLIFGTVDPPAFAYIPFALLAWAGLRFSLIETLVQLVVFRSLVLAMTAHDRGPFARSSHGVDLAPDLELAYGQLFVVTCTVAVVALSLSSARQRSVTKQEALAKAGAVADLRLSSVVQALEAERSAVEELRELDRVKDAFVSTVSHELRTPITNIIGYTELLDDGDYGDLTPLQTGATARIGDNSRRLLALIDDLLTLSRLRSADMEIAQEPVDLVQVVRAAEHVVLPRVQTAGISLEMDLGHEPVVVTGDADKLERTALNLMTNAVKFTPRRGRVVVHLRAEEAYAHLTVSDTGVGIPPEDVELLFTQFFRSSIARERHIQGTGLGLSIVRTIVEAHGGHVEVESTVDVGTTFRVHLPLRPQTMQ